jgi:hypothetical protein
MPGMTIRLPWLQDSLAGCTQRRLRLADLWLTRNVIRGAQPAGDFSKNFSPTTGLAGGIARDCPIVSTSRLFPAGGTGKKAPPKTGFPAQNCELAQPT